ncbi:MAG: hypothetical protein ACTSYL_12240 [Candidatus Thorarchaeota archaeon]
MLKRDLGFFSLLIIIIMISSMPLATFGHVRQASSSNKEQTASPLKFTPAETNLSREVWRSNHIANGNMESWEAAHRPSDFSTDRSRETKAWYATTPEPVNEGSRSLAMQAKAIDAEHPAQLRITKQQWIYWSNPVNTTLKVDYYINQNPNPGTNADAFYLTVTMESIGARYLNYYLSGVPDKTNSSYYAYFIINSTLGSWKTLDRNLTRDFIEAFGQTPTQFDQFNFYLNSVTNDYLQAYIDDVNFLNGTDVKIGGDTNFGNFETTGTGIAWYWIASDPADIVQSSMAHEGSWSANLTAMSSGLRSRATMDTYVKRRLSVLNPDRFTFYWQLNDLQHSSKDVYAYVHVECSNGTNEEFDVYYLLSYGETLPIIGGQGNLLINATGFNETGAWHYFNRSVFEDVRAVNTTTDLIVQKVSLLVYAYEAQGRISVLFDDMAFVAANLNDMSYEDQRDIGSEVLAWGDCHQGDYPEFTVTGDAKTGNKAANLTLTNGESTDMYQELQNMAFNNSTELYLDLNWKLLSFSGQTDEYIMIGVEQDYGGSIGYILANNSPVESVGSFDKYVVVPEANTTDTWLNFQRDLYHDFKTIFNTTINSSITTIYISASTETGGNLTILFDDIYLYTDPAPGLSGVDFTPTAPTQNDIVTVTVVAVDPSLDNVLLHYRVNNGTWTEVSMAEASNNQYTGTIPVQSVGAVIDFYVSANDTYGKVTTALNGTEYYTYTVVQAQTTSTTTTTSTTSGTTPTTSPAATPPDFTMVLIALCVIGVLVVLIIVYFVTQRSKQHD